MRVKIKKTPASRIKPLYQQDSTLGLNAYLLPMVQKDKEPETTINNNEKEVPRDEANAELEKGEVVYKLGAQQLTKVGGKKHAQGGTPVSLDAGDFVFSEYLKMPEEDQEMLDMKGKDISYAKAAGKLVKPFNNSVHILNTSDDKLDKETAALSLEGMQNKLGKIATLQEASKGFKDGIPEISKKVLEKLYGSATPEQQEVMQVGGIYPKIGRKLSKDEWQSKIDKEGYQRVENTNWATKKTEKKTYTPYPYEGPKDANYNQYLQKLIDSEYTYEEAVGKNYIDNSPQWKAEWQKRSGKFDSQLTGDMIYFENDNIPEPKGSPVAARQKLPDNPATHPNDPSKIYESQFGDTGYGFMDAVSMTAPFAQGIKRYPPIRLHLNAQQQNYRPVDYTAQRQAVMGQVKTLSDATDVTSPNAQIASARKASFLSQVLDPMNQSFMQEFNTNQLGYQQIEAQNAQARQQADAFNIGQDDQYNVRYAQMNENFDARKAQRFSQFLKAWDSAEGQRQERNLYNFMNEDFKIGPNQEIFREKKSNDQMMQRITGQGPASSQSDYGDIFQQISNLKQVASQYNVDLTNEQALSLLRRGDVKYTENDKNNDGYPDSVSASSTTPSLFNRLRMLRRQ